VKPGSEAEFQRFFFEEALPMIREQRGLVSVRVGLPVDRSPRSFAMITTWSDLDALKLFAGDDWAEAVIDPREAHLLAEVRIAHYLDS
jgi:heme-degrading monooxygenase HmoA